MQSSLLQKISDGRTDLIFDLVDLQSPPIDYKTLMRHAAYYGDVSAIKYLVTQGAVLSELGSNFDLNSAAFHNHWQLCQYLLEHGANASMSNPNNGETPLHSAISKSNNLSTVIVAEVLLSHGANPNAKTIAYKETGAFMRDAKTQGETPLHRAAAFGSVELIDLLLSHGADVMATDHGGDTPLGWASWHLRPGAILSKLMHSGETLHPLHVQRMKSDHGFGYGGGTMNGLNGKPHL